MEFDVSKFQGLIDWQEVKNILILQSLDVGMEVIWKVKMIRILKRNADECTRFKKSLLGFIYILCNQ
mgnify:CR=1 FL=1